MTSTATQPVRRPAAAARGPRPTVTRQAAAPRPHAGAARIAARPPTSDGDGPRAAYAAAGAALLALAAGAIVVLRRALAGAPS